MSKYIVKRYFFCFPVTICFYNYGGNDNQGIASLPYMYPTIQPQEEIVEEPEEISFYDILRQNLGLV